MSKSKQGNKQFGATLIGACITLAVSATLVGKALPSMTGAQQHQQLRAAADQMRTDIQELRQMAVTGGRSLSLHVEGACYIVHDGANGDCRCDAVSHEAVCRGDTQALKVQWPAASLAIGSSRDSIFAAGQGTVSPTATITLRSRSGEELRQVIAITGRVRTCAVGGASSGLPAC